MSSNNEHTTLLQNIFDNVTGWLHFAEAKNAAIIAFNIALMAAIFSFDLLLQYMFIFCILVILLIGSIAISLWSFKPINSPLPKSKTPNISPNLIHFAYLAGLDCNECLEQMYINYWETPHPNVNDFTTIEKDYCDEIIQNSRITIRKQKLFEKGLIVDLISLVVLVICIICA